MIYVTPVPRELRGRLTSLCRLYAYPAEPEAPPPDGFAILDSGAFGLSQRGEKMTPRWMRGLAEHYRRHGGERVVCIAPDVFLDPAATVANWHWWQKEPVVTVAPVIQFRHKRKLDVYTAIQQAKAYAPARPPFVAISNPGLRAVECRDLMPVICAQVRAITGAKWLHNLGAGWDMADIHAWRNLGCFDSIDSIAYYTAAQDGIDWSARGATTWPERAAHNALAAQPVSETGHQTY
jgi:hypothetical protein